MPISRRQSSILRLIAAKRNPESYIAGAVPINRAGPRYSADIDVFHDRQERVADAATTDAKILADAGYEVQWIRQQPATYSATIRLGPDETKLEWVADSDFTPLHHSLPASSFTAARNNGPRRRVDAKASSSASGSLAR